MLLDENYIGLLKVYLKFVLQINKFLINLKLDVIWLFDAEFIYIYIR